MSHRDPPRFTQGGGGKLGKAVFGALRDEPVPAHLKARTLASLGLTSASAAASTTAAAGTTATSTTTAAATTAKAASTFLVAKWIGLGVLGASALIGTARGVQWLAQAPAPPAVASTPHRSPAPTAAPLFPPPDPALAEPPNALVPPAAPSASSSPPPGATTPPPLPGSPLRPLDPLPTLPVIPPAEESSRPASPDPPPPAPSAAPATSTPIASPADSSGPRPHTTVDGELAALGSARSALAAGDVASALRQLAAYRSAFPRGQLGAEATVLEIEAAVRAGDRAGALQRARAFLAANPASPHAPRVRALVGLGE